MQTVIFYSDNGDLVSAAFMLAVFISDLTASNALDSDSAVAGSSTTANAPTNAQSKPQQPSAAAAQEEEPA